jgi:tryptophan-rich sensory protein
MAKRFTWWEGALFFAGVQLAQWGIRAAVRRSRRVPSSRVDRDFYRAQRQAVFAPPGAAFPIAWTINSVCAIAGAIHVLNRRRGGDGRQEFLRWQGVAWTLFAVFNTAYFELRSPINAALVTVGYSLATITSVRAALRMGDRRAALSLLPTALWLMLANPVALTTAVWNKDEFWGTGPAMQAPKWLLK